MSKKDEGFLDALITIGAIFGAAWLGIEILKSISKKETVYDCPVCKYSVKFGTKECPNCHSKLSWPTNPASNG